MKNLRFLFDNISAIQTIEDVKQFLNALRQALIQADQKQQQTTTELAGQLSEISESAFVPGTLYLTDDNGYFIRDDDGELIEIEE